MARNRKDFCIFCDANPCECNGKPAPKSKAKVSKSKPVDPELARLQERAARRKSSIGSTQDGSLTSALNVLASILHPEELDRYGGMITVEINDHELEKRKLAWRKKYGSSQRRV